MRYVFLFLIFLSNFQLYASELNFSYSYKHLERSFNLELYELSKIFEEKNFSRLSAFPFGNLPMIHADEIMYSPYHKGSIFIKMNLIAPENLQHRVVQANNFFLYHTKNASLAFFDFSEEEVEELTKKLKPDFFSKTKILDMFVSTASASSEIGCSSYNRDDFKNVDAIFNNISTALLVKRLGECGVNALKGMDDKYESTLNFFSRLKDKPMMLWTEMKKEFENLYHFIANLSSELHNFFQTITGLNLDEQLEIGCKMIGEAVPGLVMMATGAGIVAGTTKIIAQLVPKMQKLRQLLLLNRGRKFASAKDAIDCAL